MEGCQVEISYTNNRFKKVWYSATIELERQTKPKSRFRQRCVRVLKDDSLAPLTIKEGSIVDADHKDEWWVGLVVKQVGDDKFLVLFDTPSDIVLFKREQLRVHLDWVDETWWVLPGRSVQFLRQLHEKPMFISGAMVEVSDKIDKGEVVWVPAIIIKEIEEEDEKKYFVKVCVNPSSFEGIKKRPNKEVDMRSIRPRPPPFSAEELKLVDYIEVFHGTSWRQGRVIGRVFRGRCKVLLEATNKLPSKVWEDGVWKPRESPSTQGSVDEMSDSSSTFSPASNSPRENPMESPLTQGLVDEISDSGNTFSPVSNSPPVTPSPSISATPLMQTRENGTREDNNRKRKREEKLSSVEETEARDITMVLPFEKKLPIWKTVESMEVFKTFPQSPHFTPLLEIREDAREMSAVGMLLTFSGLLEEVKSLKLNNPISSLNSLSDSFTELEKHGFDVKVPMLRISKLLSLIDRQAKKMEELEDCEKVTAEKESTKVENERKILELQKLNEEADKEIAQSKSCEATIGQQLDDVKLQFHTTASAPW
ncbi:BnaA02g21930D [Brassica napus]|uniref:BnaA02g21930D protein n=1 Tax=Brassica napus TaxID=3708 RepID=A0A078GKY2_BRANA|nr:BnaA02g21930D [Brassica napus]